MNYKHSRKLNTPKRLTSYFCLLLDCPHIFVHYLLLLFCLLLIPRSLILRILEQISLLLLLSPPFIVVNSILCNFAHNAVQINWQCGDHIMVQSCSGQHCNMQVNFFPCACALNVFSHNNMEGLQINWTTNDIGL